MQNNKTMDKISVNVILLVALIIILVAILCTDANGQDPSSGDVKVVPCCATYKVKVVDHNPDYIIRVVNTKPINNYEWRFVRAFPDFTIQFVDFGEDFSVKLFNY
jgi:hypothetical protein